MARPNQRTTIDRRITTSYGHSVKWESSMDDLLILKSWHFSKNYRTFCGTTPSSWKFEMWLPEVNEDGTASLTVSLERVDSDPVELKVFIGVDIRNTSENLIFPKQSITRTSVSPGDAIPETMAIRCLPNMRSAIHRNVVVYNTLGISECHLNNSDNE